MTPTDALVGLDQSHEEMRHARTRQRCETAAANRRDYPGMKDIEGDDQSFAIAIQHVKSAPTTVPDDPSKFVRQK